MALCVVRQMSKRKEKISAFLDNDLHRDELMSFSLSGESDDSVTVHRYQIIGETLRDELSDAAFVDVSSAVREALADENIADNLPLPKAAIAVGKTGLFDSLGWFKPAAGMAFAVMVAVVMVFGLSEQGSDSLPSVATNVDIPTLVKPTSVAVDTSIKNTSPLAAQVLEANQNADINPYINQHLEFAAQDALQGRLPYVRAVSYENNNAGK